MRNYIYNHTSPENAYLVEDYPYGFRLRTKIRYWIETNKNGDRFWSQTLNPKTGAWNKPKAGTYNDVAVMFLDENNHVKYTAFSEYDDEEKMDERLAGMDQSQLNAQQLEKLKVMRACFRARKYIKVEVVESTNWTPEQKIMHDMKQEAVRQDLVKIVSHEYANI